MLNLKLRWKKHCNLEFLPLQYIVVCQGVVKLGRPDPWYNWDGPTKVGACKFTESSHKVLNKEHLFDFVVTFYLTSLRFNTPQSIFTQELISCDNLAKIFL